MIIPPRIEHYYDLIPGKYIRVGQNRFGQAYLSQFEIDRCAFLKTHQGQLGQQWMYRDKTNNHEHLLVIY